MALTREIESIIREFDYNLYLLAEAMADLRDELNKKEQEIAKHTCDVL